MNEKGAVLARKRQKIIVAGTREFDDYAALRAELDRLQRRIGEFVIISGGARGADRLAERYAHEKGLTCKVFEPDWSKGRGAGKVRNAEMAAAGDQLVAFWDGRSPGTQHMIALAKLKGLDVVVKYFRRKGETDGEETTHVGTG